MPCNHLGQRYHLAEQSCSNFAGRLLGLSHRPGSRATDFHRRSFVPNNNRYNHCPRLKGVRSAASKSDGQQSKSDLNPLLVGGVGACIGLAGLILFKTQWEVLEGLLYGDTGLGDISAAGLWAVGLYFCSPYQLLLLFLGKIETERPSDWVLQKLGTLTGQRTEDVGYTAPAPLQALTILFFIGAGAATAYTIHAGLGDATWSVSSGIGTCAAAGLYEVGRPDRLSGQQAKTLEMQWQDFAAWADERLQKSGQCHESEIYSSFRKQFARYRSPETLSDAALKDMVRNWHPSASRTANGFYKNISVQAKVDPFTGQTVGNEPAKAQPRA